MHIMTFHGWKPLEVPSQNITPAPKDPTWLSDNKLTAPSIAGQYCNAIRDYIKGRIDKNELKFLMESRNVI